eukprot:5387862-Pleurochrysis_carterae.AAC.7
MLTPANLGKHGKVKNRRKSGTSTQTPPSMELARCNGANRERPSFPAKEGELLTCRRMQRCVCGGWEMDSAASRASSTRGAKRVRGVVGKSNFGCALVCAGGRLRLKDPDQVPWRRAGPTSI